MESSPYLAALIFRHDGITECRKLLSMSFDLSIMA
jgi:hypothetical protein